MGGWEGKGWCFVVFFFCYKSKGISSSYIATSKAFKKFLLQEYSNEESDLCQLAAL